jgi:hypothetical protein
MKIYSFLLIMIFSFTATTFPQVQFTPHTITTVADRIESVYAIDVDGDGDMDVLSASYGDDKIAWYENDGNEIFTTHTITTNADGAYTVYATDVDGDGDIDVFSASYIDNKIAWYANDGNENFTPHTITTDAGGALSVYAIDMEGDGDIDVFSASQFDDKIAWYENDGNENFTPHIITTGADGAQMVYVVDVDYDGDKDVLSASYFDDKIAWYKNDGNENFTPYTITTSAAHAHSIYSIDVDGDGDMDVLSASRLDDKLAWYENDGNENFTTHTITTSADGAWSVYAIDIDGDGDIDVLSASMNDHNIAWYENDGNENFITHTITTDALGARFVYAADVDDDGDIDVLSASYDDDKVVWYENLGIEDTTPPEIIIGTETLTLWPANHKYESIHLSDFDIEIVDDGDDNVGFDDLLITSLSSDEEENGKGDGNTIDDMVLVDCQEVNLRKERSGNGNGRVYSINVAVTDNAGNTATATCYVTIPHNKKEDAIDDGVAYSIEGCAGNGAQRDYTDNNEKDNTLTPTDLHLAQNFPNPFNPSTLINYHIPEAGYVTLKVYDVIGNVVANLVSENKGQGSYSVSFDASNLPSGIYVYQLKVNSFIETKKMILMK